VISLLPESVWHGVLGSCPIHLPRLYSVYCQILYRTGKSPNDYMSDNSLVTPLIAGDSIIKTFFLSDNSEYRVPRTFIGPKFQVCRCTQGEQEVLVIVYHQNGFRHAKSKKQTPLGCLVIPHWQIIIGMRLPATNASQAEHTRSQSSSCSLSQRDYFCSASRYPFSVSHSSKIISAIDATDLRSAAAALSSADFRVGVILRPTFVRPPLRLAWLRHVEVFGWLSSA